MLNVKRVFFLTAFLLGLALLIGGCGDGATVTRMAPGQAPDIEAAALEAVPGGGGEVIGLAMEEEGGETVYEVEILSKNGKTYEVEVSADGNKVLEIEEGDDDDDDDDDNDNDDDKDDDD